MRYLGPDGAEIEEPFVITNELIYSRAEDLGVTENEVRMQTNIVGESFAVSVPEAEAFFFDKVPKSELADRASQNLVPASQVGALGGVASLSPDGTLPESQRVPNPPQLQPRMYVPSGQITAVTTSSKSPLIANRVATIEIVAPTYPWFPMIFGSMRAKRGSGTGVPYITVTDELGMQFAYGRGNERSNNYETVCVAPVSNPKTFQAHENKMFSIYLHCENEENKTGEVTSNTTDAAFSCLVVPA